MRSLASIRDTLRMSEDDVGRTLSIHPDMNLDDYFCNQAMEEYIIEELKKYLEAKQEYARDRAKKTILIAVSGGFDPIHIGHLRMFADARKLGDRLVVILNNDHWLMKKKGFVFMPETERAEIIRHVRGVDDVRVTKHTADTVDMSVCEALRELKPDVFVNGGDRKEDNIPEAPLCREIGCAMVFDVGLGGKVQSSSWLLSDYESYLSTKKARS